MAGLVPVTHAIHAKRAWMAEARHDGDGNGGRMPNPLVSTEWLSQRLEAPDVVVVDASWYLPAMNRDPEAEYLAGHIPGAVRFDIDTVKDKDSPCRT